MEFVDIAGLVAGASKGEGLGNQFLAHIREVDAIAHVVRCFDEGDVVHVAGAVDPIADIETIGIHYSFTIQKWYENWLNAEEYITNIYGGRLYRIWKAFLAWSVIIARQGNSTCYQIVCHKNSNHMQKSLSKKPLKKPGL